jgi:hypothetical protein
MSKNIMHLLLAHSPSLAEHLWHVPSDFLVTAVKQSRCEAAWVLGSFGKSFI